jgi:hypothetical protein
MHLLQVAARAEIVYSRSKTVIYSLTSSINCVRKTIESHFLKLLKISKL